MNNSKLVALLIAIGMVLWVLSGDFTSEGFVADEGGPSDPAPIVEEGADDQPQNTIVRAVQSRASDRTTFLTVRAQTQANREVEVKSEVAGMVERIPAERGTRVNEGDLLCEIAVDSRRSDLAEAMANLKSAQLEFDGVRDLNKQGLQSEINLAKAKAVLEQSRARAKRAELALSKTRITAPFAGIVEKQPVEAGDYLTPGATCVTLLEVDPMVIIGRVAERDVSRLRTGDTVNAELITGTKMQATVTFIGLAPDPVTRTYELEATVANPGDEVRAGMTATMQVPTGVENAHLISSASLVLDDEGVIGVRIIDEAQAVRFRAVSVVGESKDGVWITGLPVDANIIVVGQEEVTEGQIVRADFSPLSAIVRN